MRRAALILLMLFTIDGFTRDAKVVREFKKLYPCPYEIGNCIADHITPLSCGGADSIENLQWQTKAAAKEKDRWEFTGMR